jgi:HAD superfamily hydrolase (TIGR01509 family)
MPIPPFLLLDLDDTILDYDATGMACWEHYFKLYAAKLDIEKKSLKQAVETSRRWYWSDMRRYRVGRLNQLEARRAIIYRAFRALGLDRGDCAEEFAVEFTREREVWIRVFPGALSALDAFHSAGTRMALVTNGQESQQQEKIKRFDLARYFDLVWIEGERGVGKPEAVVFQEAMRSLSGRPEQTWMIGDDARFDIRPAHAAGLRTAWIDIGRDQEEDVPWDMRAASLIELCNTWLET